MWLAHTPKAGTCRVYIFFVLGCSLRIYLLTFLLSVGPGWLFTWNIVPWEHLFYTFKEIQYLVLGNIKKKLTMATGGQLTILNSNDQTNLDFPPIPPIDGNTAVIENNDKGLTQDQAILKTLYSILEILTRTNTTIATKYCAHGMIQELSYSLNVQTQINKQHNSDPTFDNVPNSSISDCTDIKQTVDNSEIRIQMNQRLKPLVKICKTKQITLTLMIKISWQFNQLIPLIIP